MAVSRPPVYQEYYTRTPFQFFSGVGWKRLVAFRADEQGVFLGGPVTRYSRFSVTVPWRDIEALVLWATKRVMERPIRRIGLKLQPGAPHSPGPNEKITPQLAASIAPHVEHEIVKNSRFIKFWKVDHARLSAAMQAFAPGVRLVVPPVYEKRSGGGDAFDLLDF